MNILIIDDHSIIVEGLKSTLNNIPNRSFQINFDSALNYKDALDKIKKSSKMICYDVIFLDIILKQKSKSVEKDFDGENIGLEINKYLPKSKLIILTSLNDYHRIRCIHRNLKPKGLLIKSDVTTKEIISAFLTIVNGSSYFSSSIKDIFKKDQIILNQLLDEYDRDIIYFLSKGVATKDLTKHIPLSISAIEKRKRHLKLLFNINEKGNNKLIEQSKKMKII